MNEEQMKEVTPAPVVELLTYDDVARRLRVSRRTLERQVSVGALRACYIGARVKFHPDDVNQYVESLRKRAA